MKTWFHFWMVTGLVVFAGVESILGHDLRAISMLLVARMAQAEGMQHARR